LDGKLLSDFVNHGGSSIELDFDGNKVNEKKKLKRKGYKKVKE
jgi:hypothetical protein